MGSNFWFELEGIGKIRTVLCHMLTHYPGHSDQVFLLDLPQSHQALVRDWRCYGLEQQKSEDHDIFHRGCKAEHTQQHGWLCFPDFQPNILLLRSWVYVKQTPVDKQKQTIKKLRDNAPSDHSTHLLKWCNWFFDFLVSELFEIIKKIHWTS